MTALDLCQLHYQALLVIYLKFIAKIFIIIYKELSYNCKKCGKEHLKPMNGLIKKISNTYEFCNGDVNKFILLLRKGVYPSEFMDSWERFNKVRLLEKEAFFSE